MCHNLFTTQEVVLQEHTLDYEFGGRSHPYQPSLIPAPLFLPHLFDLVETGIVCSSAVTVIAALQLDEDTTTFNTSYPREPERLSFFQHLRLKLNRDEGSHGTVHPASVHHCCSLW